MLLLFDGNITGTEVKHTNISQELIDTFFFFNVLCVVHWHLRRLPPSASCFYVLTSACFFLCCINELGGGERNKAGLWSKGKEKLQIERERLLAAGGGGGRKVFWGEV